MKANISIQNPPKNNLIYNHCKEDIEKLGNLENVVVKVKKKKVKKKKVKKENNKIVDINNNTINNINDNKIKNNKRKVIINKNQKLKFRKKDNMKQISQESIKSLVSDDSKPKEVADNVQNFNIFLGRSKGKKRTKNKKNILCELHNIINQMDNDEEVNKKELNNIPFTQALRIDKRNYLEMFFSVLVHEIDIINIFYYRKINTYIAISLSIYAFELFLDLTFNCVLYTDDIVSKKYKNNGSIGAFTSLSLAFMSNITSSIISNILGNLADYEDMIDLIIKDAVNEKQYFNNIKRFRKYLAIKVSAFYIIQTIMNALMFYYLMIFCTIYKNTQISVFMNYLLGIIQSLLLSLGLSLLISLIRFLSIKYRWKSIYNTSKYLFENF